MRPPEQHVEILERAEHGVDRAVVLDVVAVVGHRRLEERRDPDRVDAERGDVLEAPGDAGQIADAVAVAVLKAARVDLIDHRPAPPLVHGVPFAVRLPVIMAQARPCVEGQTIAALADLARSYLMVRIEAGATLREYGQWAASNILRGKPALHSWIRSSAGGFREDLVRVSLGSLYCHLVSWDDWLRHRSSGGREGISSSSY